MNRVKKIAGLFAPSGSEDAVRKFCMRYQGELQAETDGCGNLIFHRPGSGKRIAYVCGMDERGIFLSHEEKQGVFRYTTLGNFDTESLNNRQIRFEGGSIGIAQKDFVSIMCGNVQIGESGAVYGDITETEETLIGFGCARAICCEILLQLTEKESEDDLWFVFSSLYQMGKKGALVALSCIKPELAFFIEPVSTEKREESSLVFLNKGPVLKLRDGAFMDFLHLSDFMEESKLPFQFYVSSEAEIMGKSPMIFGVLSVVIGIPFESDRYFKQTVENKVIQQTIDLIDEIKEKWMNL